MPFILGELRDNTASVGRRKNYPWYMVGFPTGRDSAIFRDKGTKVSSLSRNKGTTGQAQNFATGRDGTGF